MSSKNTPNHEIKSQPSAGSSPNTYSTVCTAAEYDRAYFDMSCSMPWRLLVEHRRSLQRACRAEKQHYSSWLSYLQTWCYLSISTSEVSRPTCSVNFDSPSHQIQVAVTQYQKYIASLTGRRQSMPHFDRTSSEVYVSSLREPCSPVCFHSHSLDSMQFKVWQSMHKAEMWITWLKKVDSTIYSDMIRPSTHILTETGSEATKTSQAHLGLLVGERVVVSSFSASSFALLLLLVVPVLDASLFPAWLWPSVLADCMIMSRRLSVPDRGGVDCAGDAMRSVSADCGGISLGSTGDIGGKEGAEG